MQNNMLKAEGTSYVKILCSFESITYQKIG